MSLKVADIKSGLKTLNVRDFKLRHDARSFELFKKVKETGDQYFIDITYASTSYGYRLQPPRAHIYFRKIEEVVMPIYKKYGLFLYESSESIRDTCANWESRDRDMFGLENPIESVEAFSSVLKELQRVIDVYCLPSIDKYSDIETVAQFLDGLDFKTVVSHVNTQGPCIGRVALIYKVAKHPNYLKILVDLYEMAKKDYEDSKMKSGPDHWLS